MQWNLTKTDTPRSGHSQWNGEILCLHFVVTWSNSIINNLYQADTSLKRTQSYGPNGVRLRGIPLCNKIKDSINFIWSWFDIGWHGTCVLSCMIIWYFSDLYADSFECLPLKYLFPSNVIINTLWNFYIHPVFLYTIICSLMLWLSPLLPYGESQLTLLKIIYY